MARRNRRRRDDQSDLSAPGAFMHSDRVTDRSGEWIVRRVPGSASDRRYVCPGCNQQLLGSTAHVVAWPDGWNTGVDDRRHWHSACWDARVRRDSVG